MSIQPSQFYKSLTTQAEWFSERNQRINVIPSAWQYWLKGRGSLTSSLIKFSDNNFRVNVLSQKWALPTVKEALKLNEPVHIAALIREVELLCDEQVVVFARSIIPLSVYQREPVTFQGLGSKPLGHLLFNNGRARIRERDISSFSLDSFSGNKAVITNDTIHTNDKNQIDTKIVYGRATPYEYGIESILVSEFFVNPVLVSP